MTSTANITDDASHAAAAAPVLHLPAFTPDDAKPWFQRVESQFRLRDIKSSSKRADFVLGALPADVFSRLSLWLEDQPSDVIKYEDLKPVIIQLCEPSPEEKSQRLLELLKTPLGDQRPSDAFREIKSLARILQPDGTSAKLDLERVLWMTRLPTEIRTHITDFASRPEKDLLRLADSVRSTSRFAQPTAIAAAYHETEEPEADAHVSAVQQKRRSFRPNTTPAPDVPRKTLCYFHRRFGRDARNCRPPCDFSKNL